MQRLPDPLRWLERRIPLSLLIDILSPAGPDSRRILRDEQAETSWVRDPAPG